MIMRPARAATIIPALFGLLAIGSIFVDLLPFLQGGTAWQALFTPDDSRFDQIFFHYSTLPRTAMAFMCGAGLAVAGAAIQTIFRNPLASPTTLGVGAGVELALTIFLVMAPASLAPFQDVFTLAGGMIALGIVYLIASGRSNATLWLILAGMIVNLLLHSATQIFMLFNQQYLDSIFMWGAGDLAQNGWDSACYLAPRLVLGIIAIFALTRPLDILALGDDTANSLGAPVKWLRLIILTIAIFITASIISAVGMIGFIGLAVPATLRFVGFTRSKSLLPMSLLVGGCGLVVIDYVMRQFAGTGGDIFPTGAATALIGAPFVIVILRKARIMPDGNANSQDHPADYNLAAKHVLMVLLFVGLLAGLALSLLVSLDGQGDVVFTPIADLFAFTSTVGDRAQRTLAAIVCGAALAVSGTLIQRVGHNPMASPEITGVSSATALAMIIAMVYFGIDGRTDLMLIGAVGGVIALMVLLGLCRNFSHAPHYLLLNGLAITAILGSVVRIAMTHSGTKATMLISWLAGTTYFTRMDEVIAVAMITAILTILTLLARRPLELASMGPDQAVSLGLGISMFRLAMMMGAAILAAVSTLLVGPLSFVGLMAPHLARIAGFRLAGAHLIGAILIGANVMMVAEWLARNILYPQQLPTGLIAALIGTGYFLVLSARRR
ncbi:Fe(3+)-hydroxamate ABC transporter permease FhuB [Thalassospira mesophila]|uniref:Iron-hydroxamate transporter permease subunit n=1 Tax=Thalassospira mesophila TaxID=1293891 RepID=A0A1Y2KZ24_9PROT|nr:Fe(3+)-hydroxamate ABC transporter permease FhuB [Thalassospira mesophila]OSQ37448.1 iron-hydroxamate transporter permease subunit [Thalassospira mesophila]